ncbi:sensor histidine kinase [Oleiharenicola lentus]|uniref:sensor histidine kinase n=1 Tax=Oleiharenicola lentus TaxID=2508720 RepID=UPI003F67FBAD
MTNLIKSAPQAWWRRERLWFGLWLLITVAGIAWLWWDAHAWLSGEPSAVFRDTDLKRWPLEVLWWVFLPLILLLQRYLNRSGRHWAWAVALHGLTAFAITALFVVLQGARMVVVNHLPASFLPVVVNDLGLLRYWNYLPAHFYLALVLALYAMNFYREWRAGQQLTGELQVANAQLETRLVRASLDALKMQLHPHFLFNTLNSITSLIRNGRTREAEEIVAGLGELLRRALDHRQESREALEHELEFLRRYLEIESIRFQDRLKVEWAISPKCLRALVPSLILQPLVENAMKHGISKDASAQILRISAERDGTRLLLSVYNDGPALPSDEDLVHGIGTQNTIARLNMLYGDDARLRLRDQLPRGVRAEIIIPFQTNSP